MKTKAKVSCHEKNGARLFSSFLLECNWFKMLCQFLLYNTEDQLPADTGPSLLALPPNSHPALLVITEHRVGSLSSQQPLRAVIHVAVCACQS